MSKEKGPLKEEKQFVDTDQDGLDDRLNRTSIRENETIKDVLHRLDQLQIRTLPETTILKMIEEVEAEQQKNLDQAHEFERHVHQQIVKGHYDALKKMRKQIRYLSKNFEDLEEEKSHLLHVVQEQRLKNNMEMICLRKYLFYLVGVVILQMLLIYSLNKILMEG